LGRPGPGGREVLKGQRSPGSWTGKLADGGPVGPARFNKRLAYPGNEYEVGRAFMFRRPALAGWGNSRMGAPLALQDHSGGPPLLAKTAIPVNGTYPAE